jgi:ABC-type spermidine/putrescine transport system permease subunit II
MMVFASVRLGLSPQINALATLWIAAVALGLMLALRLGRPRN